MSRAKVPVLTVGEQGIVNRLRDETKELRRRERMAAASRKRRDQLVAELLHAGIPERYIGSVADMSGPAVHQLKDRLIRNGVLKAKP